MKKHHNQKPVESPVKQGDLILTVNHTAKAFDPKYKKGTYRVVKVHGNQVDIQDFRGHIFTVHATHMKKTTLTDKVVMTTYDCAMREDSLRSVCQEDTSHTSTGQPYMMTQINPSSQ